MKILTSTCTLIIIITFFSSCLNATNKDDEPINNYKKHIRGAVTTFATKTIEKIAMKREEKISIDTIEIAKIDTLTDKTILTTKYNLLFQEILKISELMDLESEQFKLKNELGVYENETLRNIAKNDLKEIMAQLRKEMGKLDSITNLLKNNPDSLTFRYYFVSAKITATGEDLIQKTIDLEAIVTHDYKIKMFSDL